MPTQIITTDDLREFKMELLKDIKNLLKKEQHHENETQSQFGHQCGQGIWQDLTGDDPHPALSAQLGGFDEIHDVNVNGNRTWQAEHPRTVKDAHD